VDVDEHGNIDKRDLRLALKDLAKRKPHLVRKPATTSDDDTSTDDTTDADTKSSGSRMNGQRKGRKTNTDRAALAQRFPVLNQNRT
jgi:hypothetical protein